MFELTHMPSRRRCSVWLLSSSKGGRTVVAVGSHDIEPETLLDISNRFRKGPKLDRSREILFGAIPLDADPDNGDHSYSPESGDYVIDADGSRPRLETTAPREATIAEAQKLSGLRSVAMVQSNHGKWTLLVLPFDMPDESVRSVIDQRFSKTVRYSIINSGALTCAEDLVGREFPILLVPETVAA